MLVSHNESRMDPRDRMLTCLHPYRNCKARKVKCGEERPSCVK